MAKKTNEWTAVWQYLATHNLKDITSDIADKVNNVKSLMTQGKYGEAARLVDEYNIKEYIMSSDYVNAIDEKTRNLEIDFKEKSQCIFYTDTEPDFETEDNVWIGG